MTYNMTTRSKKKPVTVINNNAVINKRTESSWILLIKDSLFKNDDFQIITLPHPGNGQPTKFCLDHENRKIYEVVTFSEPYRSWFIGDTVKSDGSILMVTPFNPIYLVLPKLMQQCKNRAIPLEDLLSEKEFDKISNFLPDMDCIADLKGPADLKAYKFNEEKTITWLETKVRKLAKALREKNIHVTSGAVSATFVTSTVNNDTVDEEFYLKYAHGMVSDYLQEELANSLEKHLNFKPELVEAIGTKRKSEVNDLNNSNKKIKFENNENGVIDCAYQSNDTTEIKKQKPLTAKEKARQKAASGTKTISAFFTKK